MWNEKVIWRGMMLLIRCGIFESDWNLFVFKFGFIKLSERFGLLILFFYFGECYSVVKFEYFNILYVYWKCFIFIRFLSRW